MELLQLLMNILSVSGVCLGIKVASGPGMVFYNVSEWVRSKIGDFWHKPLFGCPGCMSSTWGSLTLILLNGFSNLAFFPIILLSCIPISSALFVAYELHMSKYDS
jgi:hypothetical protein